jgi:hypothetical protein
MLTIFEASQYYAATKAQRKSYWDADYSDEEIRRKIGFSVDSNRSEAEPGKVTRRPWSRRSCLGNGSAMPLPFSAREIQCTNENDNVQSLLFPLRVSDLRSFASKYVLVSYQVINSYSMNVTLLISFRVEIPANAFCRADSRRKVIPSSWATRLISEAGFLSRIISRIRSDRSSNS